MTDPWTGEVVRAKSAAERLKALASGMYVEATRGDVEQAKRREKYDKPGLAFLAGVLRGGTFGFSDLLATQTGMVEAETFRGLKEFSPMYSGGGDVLGSVGTLMTGPGSLVLKGAGRAGAATTRGLTQAGQATREAGSRALGAARQAVRPLSAGAIARGELSTAAKLATPQAGVLSDLAGTAVREGVVGAALGAGQATSEIALSPEEMTAQQVVEKMARGTKEGATVFAGLGMGMRVAGRGAKAAQKYFGRGLERMEKAQGALKVAKADLKAAEAMAGDPVALSKARTDLKISKERVGLAEEALATARMDEAAGLGAQGTIKAEAALRAAQERSIVSAQRVTAAELAPNVKAIQAAQERVMALKPAAAQAEAAFANRVTGRAMGLGLAYYMGGGVGMQALGFLMGPRMMKYVNRIAGRMHGPIGGVVRDVQDAFKPEIIRYAKWPLERAVGGFAVGGLPGAAMQLGMGRVETAVEQAAGAPIMAAIGNLFKIGPQKGALNLSQWSAKQAANVQGGATSILANVEQWGESQIRVLSEIDLTGMEAALISSLNPDIPQTVGKEAVTKVVDSMTYLLDVNPATKYAQGKIPKAEMAKFRAKLATVADPEVFFKALAEGKLSPGSPEVEAMRAAYPEVIRQMEGILQSAVTKAEVLGGTIERGYLRNLQAIGVNVSAPKQYNPARVNALLGQMEPTEPGPKVRPRPITGVARASATQAQRLQEGT